MEEDTFTDPRDGNVYRTVKIGNQVWLAENLAYAIKGSKSYEGNPENSKQYGRLYNWNTAMIASPPGWHLPSSEEWRILVDFVGGVEVAGKKLKAKNGWNDYDGVCYNGTDDFGFSALPGGRGHSGGYFSLIGYNGDWWTASEYDNYYAYRRYINYSYEGTLDNLSVKSNLFSVRCVRD